MKYQTAILLCTAFTIVSGCKAGNYSKRPAVSSAPAQVEKHRIVTLSLSESGAIRFSHTEATTPYLFAAITLDATDHSRVLEGVGAPDERKWPTLPGVEATVRQWPRFKECCYEERFPFESVTLRDDSFPVEATASGWYPFIPGDMEASGAPVYGLEYSFTNRSSQVQDAIFSLNTANFGWEGRVNDPAAASLNPVKNGYRFIPKGEAQVEGMEEIVILTPTDTNYVDCCWYPGAMYDALNMAWRKLGQFDATPIAPSRGDATGASLYIPFTLKAGETKSVRILIAWQNADSTAATRGSDPGPVANYWKENYTPLKARTEQFTKAFHASTLPNGVLDGVSRSLHALKSGDLYLYGDTLLLAETTPETAHTWLYEQVLTGLFPRTEFRTSGERIDERCATILRSYQRWQATGDKATLKAEYGRLKEEMDACLALQDSGGRLVLPHETTYGVKFWGADSYTYGFYAGALRVFTEISHACRQDASPYEKAYTLATEQLDSLYNGRYFIQQVIYPKGYPANEEGSDQWPENVYILSLKEGPPYQYGSGCLTDALGGLCLARLAGVEMSLPMAQEQSHLQAAWQWNTEGGKALAVNCSWPEGGKPVLALPVAAEQWAATTANLATHLILTGNVEQGVNLFVGSAESSSEYGSASACPAGYGVLRALTGVRYNALTGTLLIDPRVGEFRVFQLFPGGFGTVALEAGQVVVTMYEGEANLKKCLVNGKETHFKYLKTK